jgi:hypothetical protein
MSARFLTVEVGPHVGWHLIHLAIDDGKWQSTSPPFLKVLGHYYLITKTDDLSNFDRAACLEHHEAFVNPQPARAVKNSRLFNGRLRQGIQITERIIGKQLHASYWATALTTRIRFLSGLRRPAARPARGLAYHRRQPRAFASSKTLLAGSAPETISSTRVAHAASAARFSGP